MSNPIVPAPNLPELPTDPTLEQYREYLRRLDFALHNHIRDNARRHSSIERTLGLVPYTQGGPIVSSVTTYGSYLLSGGGVAWISGYTYRISAATYVINGTIYNSPETSLTLTAADSTNPRIDAIALTTSSTAVAVTGTATTNPAEASIDPLSQLRVVSIFVAAGSTSATVGTTIIYAENTEWTSSVSGGTVTAASTSNPHGGTKDIEYTAAAAAAYVNLSNGSAFDTTTRNTLVFYIRSKAAWASQKSLVVQWYNGTTAVGSGVVIKTGAYGFNSSLTTSYQQIVIPLSTFGVAGLTTTAIRFTVQGGGSTVGFYLDDISMQGGVAQQTPSTSMVWRGTYSSATQYVLNDVVYYNGIAYISLQNNLGNAPTTSSWSIVGNGPLTGDVTTSASLVATLATVNSNVGTFTNPSSVTVNAKGLVTAIAAQQTTQTLTDQATIAWDVSLGPVAKVTLGGNRTLGAPTNQVDGGTYILRVIQDGTGSRTLAYNSIFKWPGGTDPVLSTAASSIDIITFVSDGTNMYGVAQLAFAT